MSESRSISEQCLQALKTPRILLGGILDLADAWQRTRAWIGISICSMGLLFTAACAFYALSSRFQYRDVFSMPFAVQMEEDLPIRELLRLAIHRRAHQLENQFALQEVFPSSPSSQPVHFGMELPEVSREIDWREARFFAACALRLAPADQRLQLRFALLDDWQGDDALAESKMKRLAPSQQSGLFPAHTWRLLHLMASQRDANSIRWQEVEHHLMHALEWDEIDAYTLMTISAWLYQRDHRTLAEPLLERAASEDTQASWLALNYFRKQGLSTQADSLAQQTAERLIDLSRNRTLDHHEEEILAECYWELGKDGECMEVLRHLCEISSELRERWKGKRLTLLLRLQRTHWQQATSSRNGSTEWMEEAAQLDPLYPDVGLLIAEGVQRRVTIPPSAQEALKTQVTTRVAAPDTHWILAKAFNERGQFASAIQRAQSALEKSPDHAGALEELAVAYIGEPRPESAAAVLQKAISGSKPSSRLLSLFGEALLAMGDEDRAAENWEESLLADPRQPALRRKLAELYQSKGLEQKAKVHLVLLGEL